MPENHLLIIALSNHSNLGPLLIPYFAREVSPGVISVEEQVSHAGKKNNLSELERQIIAIAESYSEKNLMKVYSKERTVTGFLKSVTTDMRQKLLRPFIDKKIRQMIRLMQIHKIPVYNKEAGVKLLYEHDRVLFFEHVAEVSFRFEITEQTFRYTAICKMNGEEISLQQKRRFMVFSSKPAVLFLDSHLLVFKRIEAARLVPFRFKRYVEVPVAELNKYMEKVVLPLISDYPAIPVGFDIIRESRACVPELSIDQ